jgi:hypothetical protein
MDKDLNFNERLRRNMEEKGQESAKKWNESLEKQTIEENKEAKKTTNS